MTRYALDIILGLICWAVFLGAVSFIAWAVSAWF